MPMNTVPGRLLVASVMVLTGSLTFAATQPAENGSPVFGVTLPRDYRQWQVISVAHEAGTLNDFRVILGNEIAVAAFRSDKRPFPNGAVIARIAWKYIPSAQNNQIFGQEQSFVAGDPTNVQVEVKDRERYAATKGWGYGQFEAGRPNPSEALMRTCSACHAKLPDSDDLIFTHYAP